MKLKVGMLFRTETGTIGKIDAFTEDKTEFYFDSKPIFSDGECIGSKWGYTKDIVKTCDNIIDLIEVGDYVNGYKIGEIAFLGFKGHTIKGLNLLGGPKHIYYPKDISINDLEKLDETLINAKIDFFENYKAPDYLVEEGTFKHYFLPVEGNIKSIVTKEQFERMEYKVC